MIARIWNASRAAAPQGHAMIARIWNAALAHGSVRLWAIILGAPPLCGIVVWVIDILQRLATAPDPVRADVVDHISDIGKMVVLLVGIIVVALATVKVRATTPAGSVDIGGSGDAEG